jgi:hypothetical protein
MSGQWLPRSSRQSVEFGVVPCPDCKGSSRIAIAPGYWQCTTLVRRFIPHWGLMPGTSPQLGIMGPVLAARQRPCGRRYQEAGGRNEIDVNASCACGMFAIGRCADCGVFVCGEHSGLSEGRLTCAADIGRRRREAEGRADQGKTTAVTRGVAVGEDAIERWLLARTTDLSHRSFFSIDAQQVAIDYIRILIRQAAGARSVDVEGDDVMTWSVNTDDLTHWLNKRRIPDTALYIGSLFRKYRGWHIGSSSPTNDTDRSSGCTYDVVLRTDGRVSAVRKGSRRIRSYEDRGCHEFGNHDDISYLAGYLKLK